MSISDSTGIGPSIIPFPATPLYEEEPPPPVQPVSLTVTEWTEEFRYLEGQPMRFDDQPWIMPMVNCPDPWQVWRTGRQVAKSTSLVNLTLALGCNVPFLRTLYVAPTHKQMKEYSKNRLRPAIYDSPPIRKFFVDKTCVDAVGELSLATPSQIMLRNCFINADSARGISSHVLMLDEMQDLLVDLVPILEETTSAARRNRAIRDQGYADIRRYCGTPKTYDTALELYWDDSTQNEWLVPCDHCGGGDYRYWNKLDEKNIGPEGLICKKCGGAIDWGMGEWAVSDPTARWTGWHVSQLMATEPRGWIPWDSILDRQRTYKTHVFFNEVLGVAYDSGLRPITMDQLMALSRPEYTLASVVPGLYESYAGLDWAMEKESYSSYTILTIYAIVNRRMQLQYVKKFQGFDLGDPDQVIQHVVEKMREYNVSIIGCDWGVGHFENERIRKAIDNPGVPSRLLEFQYVSQSVERKLDLDRNIYLLDRTQAMDRLFSAMKDRMLHFPEWEEFKPYRDDIYSIYSDYNIHARKKTFLHRDPDDFFQSTVFAWEAMLYYYDYRIQP